MENITEIKPPVFSYLKESVYNLRDNYKNISLSTCGKSVMGKDIYALTLGDGERNILYVGGTHGLEWITTSVLLKFSENLLNACENHGEICGYEADELLKNFKLVIIPSLNPDGADIAIKGIGGCGNLREKIYDISKYDFTFWNANANGIDLNHNFNADWYELRDYEATKGISVPSPRRFGGYFPESEPETKALVRFLRKVRFNRLYTFHSQGEEIFYEYKRNTPPKSLHIAKALAGVSGYTLVKNEGHYSSGGLKDWFIEEFKEPAFTIEIGLGSNPLPAEEFTNIYKKVEPLLVMGLIL